MFCPNCGKDCGSAKFCPECGTKLQHIAGADAFDRSAKIPTSASYVGRRGVVLLFNSAVSISTGSGKHKRRIEIPFDQLVTVIYQRPSANGWHDGVLLLRGKENMHVPIPDSRNMSFDDAAATIPLENDLLFYHVFQLLKAVAPSTTKFEMIIPETKIKRLEEVRAQIDFTSLWDRHAPFRNRAVDEIQQKYNVKREAARVLVDREFDARQKLRYEVDPKNAIRDLSLLVASKEEKDNNIIRLKAELKEYQDQQETQRSLRHIALMMLDDK